MKTQIARISVQRNFCMRCTDTVKAEIKKVIQNKHLSIYPLDALVVFSFHNANEVSEVLNTLMALGYPPKGDATKLKTELQWSSCSCNS